MTCHWNLSIKGVAQVLLLLFFLSIWRSHAASAQASKATTPKGKTTLPQRTKNGAAPTREPAAVERPMPAASMQQEKPKQARQTTPEAAEPSAPRAADFSSGAIRSRRPFGLQLQYTPFSDFALSNGGGLSFNVGSRLQFGGSYLTGSKDQKSNIDGASKFLLTTFAGQAYARWYPMAGTFSISAGLGHRQAHIEYRVETKSSDLFIAGELTVTSLVAPIFIGNHWFLNNGLFFGCDWIGVYFPLSGASKSKTTSNLGESASEQSTLQNLNDKLKKIGDGLAKSKSATLALLSIGYQF